MQVHACHGVPMRTTVEIPDSQRASLHALAIRRGEKGFSTLIQEAIAMYLEAQAQREERVRAALAAIGTLDDEAAEQLASSVRQIRNKWR